MKCIIFVNNGNIRKGSEKLNEIVSEKIKQGIELIKRRRSSISDRAVFSDGEQWIVLPVNTTARGDKWIKVYVDKEISKDIIQTIIEPLGIHKVENYKLF